MVVELENAAEARRRVKEVLGVPGLPAVGFKELLDREQVTLAHENLTCEKCGPSKLSLAWREAGRTQWMLEQARKEVADFQARTDQSRKPPQSN